MINMRNMTKAISIAVCMTAAAAFTVPVFAGTWVLDEWGYWYGENDGSYSVGWELIDGSWYHFNEYGYMQTGWINDEGLAYLLDENGVMQTGWQKYQNTWYYFYPDGHMASDGWVSDNYGRLAYVGPDGVYNEKALTWIGDSLSYLPDAYNAITSTFFIGDMEAKSEKKTMTDSEYNPSGLSVAQSMVNTGRMHEYLVFEQGTNDSGMTYDQAVEAVACLRDIIGYETKLVLITCFETDQYVTWEKFGELNQAYRDMAANDPNTAVADWAAFCDGYNDVLDGMHQTKSGAIKYARLIADVIAAYWPAY